MDVGATTAAEPVFWWWEEDESSRVVLLTDRFLILSGPLTEGDVTGLEHARRTGDLETADFGAGAMQVAVNDIGCLQFHPEDHRLVIGTEDGDRVVAPPRGSGGIALGVFDTLAKRLAPGREPVDSLTDASPPESEPALTALGTLVVVGLVCLGLAVAADQGEPAGPLAEFRRSLNGVFENLGYLPAMLAFAVAGAIQVVRIRRSSSSDGEVVAAERTLEVVVDPPVDHSQVTGVDPLAGISEPSDAGTGQARDVAVPPDDGAAGWAAPEDGAGDVWSDGGSSGETAGWRAPAGGAEHEWRVQDSSGETAGWVAPEGGADQEWRVEDSSDDAAGWVAPEGGVGEAWSAEESSGGGSWADEAGRGAPEDRDGESQLSDGHEVTGEPVAVPAPDGAGEHSPLGEDDFWNRDLGADDGPWWERTELGLTEPGVGGLDDLAPTDSPRALGHDAPSLVDPAPVDSARTRAPGHDAASLVDPALASDTSAGSLGGDDSMLDDPAPPHEMSASAPDGDASPLHDPTPPESPPTRMTGEDAPALADPASSNGVSTTRLDDDASAAEEHVAHPVGPHQWSESFEGAPPAWSATPAGTGAAPVDRSTGAGATAPTREGREPDRPAATHDVHALDADSPFAEILGREAPMPGWASAAEPLDQRVPPGQVERSVPASFQPEPSAGD